jgi:hypothetical protein
MSTEHDNPAPDAAQPGPAAPENRTRARADRPPDNGQGPVAPPLGTADKVAAGPPPAPAPAKPAATAAPRTESGLLLRQLLGLLLILTAGWGFIALVGFLAVSWKIGISFGAAAGIASLLSLGLFLLLQQNLWLSRFLGLRLSPRASPVTEALFIWVFGVATFLLRSTVNPEPTPAAAAADKGKGAPPETQDGFREIVETVVFVVVLVLLLKGFLAEAFVIPTGSMADTLLGYHRDVKCPECGHPFRINMSNQLDPDRRSRPEIVSGCTCPNCFHPFNLSVVPSAPEARQP